MGYRLTLVILYNKGSLINVSSFLFTRVVPQPPAAECDGPLAEAGREPRHHRPVPQQWGWCSRPASAERALSYASPLTQKCKCQKSDRHKQSTCHKRRYISFPRKKNRDFDDNWPCLAWDFSGTEGGRNKWFVPIWSRKFHLSNEQ